MCVSMFKCSISQFNNQMDQYHRGGREMKILRNINIEIYEHLIVSIFKCMNLSIQYLSISMLWRRGDETFEKYQYQKCSLHFHEKSHFSCSQIVV